MKPRVAIFDFGCCEGCQLQIVNLEEGLLDLLGAVDVVTWREAMAESSDDFDIAIVEGSITREEEKERLRWIREHARILVALGTCAHIGGINCMKNRFSMEEVQRYVYGEDAGLFATIPTLPLSGVVQVDAVVPGCPINRREFLEVIKALLLGKRPPVPTCSICVECKQKDNVCLFTLGEVCLGPITRAGCGAICPSYGEGCSGCRGLAPDPNLESYREVLAEHGLTPEDIQRHVTMFGGCLPEEGGPETEKKGPREDHDARRQD